MAYFGNAYNGFDVTPFSSGPLESTNSNGVSCSTNVDNMCVSNLPVGARAGPTASCPQKTTLFCASNQPYSADSGWMCRVQRTELTQYWL